MGLCGTACPRGPSCLSPSAGRSSRFSYRISGGQKTRRTDDSNNAHLVCRCSNCRIDALSTAKSSLCDRDMIRTGGEQPTDKNYLNKPHRHLRAGLSQEKRLRTSALNSFIQSLPAHFEEHFIAKLHAFHLESCRTQIPA